MALSDWPKKPLPRNKVLPYGYSIEADITEGGDPSTIVYDPVIAPLVELALDSLDNGSSYREVANWLNTEAPKLIPGYMTISHSGLRMIRQTLRPDHKPKIKRIKPTKIRMTWEERKLYNKKQKLASEKKTLKATQKRIAKKQLEIENKKQELNPVPTPIGPTIEYDHSAIPEDIYEENIIFRPNPGPQTQFLAATETQVLYGGAAAGGKSYGLLADPMRWFHNPNFSGLIVRKTLDELRELKRKSLELYPRAFPGAKFKEQTSSWHFPSGAILWMSYLERDEDAHRYQGLSFSWIGFDELTHWGTPFAWNYLFSRLRSTDPELSANLAMRATANPGGLGHGWVKKTFIDPAPPGVAFDAVDPETGETLRYPENFRDPAKAGKPLFRRKFIPAKLADNPYYSDGEYEKGLMSLPEQQRKQLLEGNWNIADGAAFPEFSTEIHVCDPFEIPMSWRKFRSCDWGYSARQWTAVHYFAIAPDDTLYVFKELYFNQKTAREAAEIILKEDRGLNISYGVLDANAWNKTGQTGPSIAEEMIKYGCRWRPADNKIAHSRGQGANRLHEVLRLRNTGTEEKPGIIFFNTCRKIISTLPILPSDPDGSDDIDQDFADDHAYDSVRYGVMSRPKYNNSFFQGQESTTKAFSNQLYRPVDPVFGY